MRRVRWLTSCGTIAIGLAVIVASIGLIVHVSPWLSAGLGDSHDGFNAGMWGLGARGGVADPIGNRLGGVHLDGSSYAHHPPLLVWSLLPVIAANDDWPLGLRLVPLAATIAALVALAAILFDAGLGKVPTAGGVLLAGSSGMLLTYGAMVDTPVFGFPFALAALWVAQRSWQGRPPRTTVVLACGVAAAVAGWQALLVAAVAGLVALCRPLRQSRHGGLTLLAGTATGLFVDIAWTIWVKGDLADLVDSGVGRTRVGWGLWAQAQLDYVADLYGPVLTLVSVVGGLIALTAVAHRVPAPTGVEATETLTRPDRWHATQPLMAVLVAGVFGYAVLFRHGAYAHDYWNYYGIAIVAVAVAAMLDFIGRVSALLSPSGRKLVLAASIGFVALTAGLGWLHRTEADANLQHGLNVNALTDKIPTAAHPGDVVVATIGGDPGKPWLWWTTRGRSTAIELTELGELDPDELVLVTFSYYPPESMWIDTSAISRENYTLIRAGDLQALAR